MLPDRGNDLVAVAAQPGMGVQKTLFKDVRTVTQLPHLLAKLFPRLFALLLHAFLELCLQGFELLHLVAELNGAADGKHGVGQINAQDKRGKGNSDGRAESKDPVPKPGMDEVAQRHTGKTEADRVEKAYAPVDLKPVVRLVPPAHMEQLFHQP